MNSTISRQIPSEHKSGLLLDRIREWRLSKTLWIFLIFVAHIPLAIAMARSPEISTAHAMITLLIGLWYAGTSVKSEQVVYLIAYITGAETLWRMTRAMVFWEYGKYALLVIITIAIIRSGRLKGPLWAFFYFLLLLPALVLPMSSVDSSEFRNQVSFNLSGPLILAICTWYLSGLELYPAQMQRVFVSFIAPTVGVASIAVFDTISAGSIYFSNNSNFVTSGGFGPNQVSAALGLGAMFTFLLLWDSQATRIFKTLMFVILVILSVQSALTFSRGGLYAAAGAAVIFVYYLIRVSKTRIKVIACILALVFLTTFIIIPKLDDFTGGALVRRFTNTKLTGRDKLLGADLQAWFENPLFGVGPGQAKTYRKDFRADASAHTEFSRMLAEHGLFGLMALVMLLLMALHHIANARPGQAKAFSAALVSWSFFYMLTAAMRLAAPSFTFGLSAINVIPEAETEMERGRE